MAVVPIFSRTAALALSLSLMPIPALACVPRMDPPQRDGESREQYYQRIDMERLEAENRWKTENQNRLWDDAAAIIVYRVLPDPPYRDLAYEKKLRAYNTKIAKLKKQKRPLPPPPFISPPPPFDIYAAHQTMLNPLETIRGNTKTGELTVTSRLSNTTCGPMPTGWLYDAQEGEAHVVFFKDGATLSEANIIGTVKVGDVIHPEIKKIYERWPSTAKPIPTP